MFRASISLATLAFALLSQPAMAQETGADSPAGPADAVPASADPAPSGRGSAAAAHQDQHGEELIVTGVRRPEGDVLGGVSVLSKAELTREVRTSIGETLARQPGVSATSFGPTASAPVLRGLSGDRVRVLTDGIGTLDLSSSGPDHKVAINPITAERIEVLRGPSALLFGSSAVGGVVNVIDTRIPRQAPDGPVSVDVLATYGSAANERSANLSIDVPVTEHFIVHADGNYSKGDDLRIGGHVLSKELRREALASPDPDIRALAELDRELPNSEAEAKEGAIGAAFVDGSLNLGFSVTRQESTYEVPIRFSLDPAVEAEAPTIDQEQTRYDVRAEIPVGGFFSQIHVRAGYANYHHDELEQSGAIGSSFYSKGGEGRLELIQSDHDGWGGTSGFQYLERNARIRGEEKFLPDSHQKQAGIFSLQTYVTGPWRFEGGGRVEFSKLTAEEDQQLGTPSDTVEFTTLSGSLGGQYEITPGWRVGLSLSHAERAPSIDELFANGPHGATQSFEVGDRDLDPEKSNSAELSLHRRAGPVHLQASVYYSRFTNFIFQAPTDATEDGLPVFETLQGKAKFAGLEFQATSRIGQALGVEWGAELQGDAVKATVKDFGPAPLIPPVRLLGALTGEGLQVDGRLEIEHAFDHSRTAPIETDTAGYTMVNASIDWHPLSGRPEVALSMAVNNLFDVDARRSTSVLRDFAPLAGRDVRLTLRAGL